jgi:hypothetical protein
VTSKEKHRNAQMEPKIDNKSTKIQGWTACGAQAAILRAQGAKKGGPPSKMAPKTIIKTGRNGLFCDPKCNNIAHALNKHIAKAAPFLCQRTAQNLKKQRAQRDENHIQQPPQKQHKNK